MSLAEFLQIYMNLKYMLHRGGIITNSQSRLEETLEQTNDDF